MKEITFNNLPEAVTQLRTELREIKRLLLEKSNEHHHPDPDQLLTIKEAAAMLSLSVPTIYGLVHDAKIPVSKKGKRLYFSRQELNDWIKSGRKKTVSEIEAEAASYLTSHKKKK